MKFKQARNFVLTRLGLQTINPETILQTYVEILAVQAILKRLKEGD